MKGVVFDINIQGHSNYMLRLIEAQGLIEFWDDLDVPVLSVPNLGCERDASDREIWNVCQSREFVLVTENRNNDGPDSLEQTLIDSLTDKSLPVLTLANKRRFEHDRLYALKVTSDFLHLLVDISRGGRRGSARIFFPGSTS